MKLLYAEDEIAMSEAVTDILAYHNYMVEPVYNGNDALDYILNDDYDGVILDIMMPGMSGLEVLKEMRKRGINTPVLLLTAKSQIEDRIEGLDLGADDYLPKPFNMGELLARVRAMLRRKDNFTPDILSFGDLTLNMQNNELSCGEKSVVLPKLEYRLMETFMINKNILISTEDLFTKVWGFNTDAEIGILWVYISYLRKRLASIGSKTEIRAKRNVGYCLEANDG